MTDARRPLTPRRGDLPHHLLLPASRQPAAGDGTLAPARVARLVTGSCSCGPPASHGNGHGARRSQSPRLSWPEPEAGPAPARTRRDPTRRRNRGLGARVTGTRRSASHPTWPSPRSRGPQAWAEWGAVRGLGAGETGTRRTSGSPTQPSLAAALKAGPACSRDGGGPEWTAALIAAGPGPGKRRHSG